MADLVSEYDAWTRRLTKAELDIIGLIQHGIPLVPRPYAAIAELAATDESTVIRIISDLIERGIIKRYGVVVQHRDLGYKANAMIVWDMPDEKLESVPKMMKKFPFITLCYRRPRRLPEWPYNLFCMIHGHDREKVLEYLKEVITACHLEEVSHDVLFSKRRFKQRGARYVDKPLATSYL